MIVENAFAISKEDEEEVAVMRERQKDADINELKILFLETCLWIDTVKSFFEPRPPLCRQRAT